MTDIAQILKQFHSLNPFEQVEVSRSINEAIYSAIIKQSKIKTLKDQPPFTLFPRNVCDSKLRQYFSTIWKKKVLIDTDFTALIKDAGMEFKKLNHLCKREIGISLRKAIDIIRIEKCRIAIDKNYSTITGIAFEIGGYNDYTTFYRQFKEKYGYGPGKHQKDCKNNNRTLVLQRNNANNVTYLQSTRMLY